MPVIISLTTRPIQTDLSAGEIFIGHTSTRPTESKSAYHARIFRKGSHINIEDHQSQHDVLVNGTSLTHAQPLNTGDIISVGSLDFVFSEENIYDEDELKRLLEVAKKKTLHVRKSSINAPVAPGSPARAKLWPKQKTEDITNLRTLPKQTQSTGHTSKNALENPNQSSPPNARPSLFHPQQGETPGYKKSVAVLAVLVTTLLIATIIWVFAR